MRGIFLAAALAVLCGCSPGAPDAAAPVERLPTEARRADGAYVSWQEHALDDEKTSGGVPLRGGDGLAIGDLDRDGVADIVSVHEDSGHVRAAWGSASGKEWFRLSLAEGDEAAGAEDVNLGDANGDGWLDAIVACERGRLLYLQNPGVSNRGLRWGRIVPEITRGRGAWIKAYLADLDGDGRAEIVAANKGAEDGAVDDVERPISWFEIDGDPLAQASWIEHELMRTRSPIQARPVDLDGDGDIDVFAGSRGERTVYWFENVTERGGPIAFVRHDIRLETASGEPRRSSAFHVEFADLDGDGRLDAVLATGDGRLSWAAQPARKDGVWVVHDIGTFAPDSMTGFVLADIDGDGDLDAMAGSYSRGPRLEDGAEMGVGDPLGRIGWFQNPGSAAGEWTRHDILRRKRGMYDSFAALDIDGDGDLDFVFTRGNSGEFDGVFWLEQKTSAAPAPRLIPARERDSEPMPLP